MRTARPHPRPCPHPVLAALLALALLVPTVTRAETSLRMTSESGDYIGLGQSYFYTTADGSFTLTGGPSGAHLSYQGASYSHWWYVDLVPPTGQGLQVGTYSGATRYPFEDASVPGLSISGDGRGCNQLGGSFRIKQVTFGGGGIASLWATFEQHCENATPALRGDLRYNATVLVEMLAPFDTTVQRGHALALDVRARTLDGGAASLTATGLPEGASFTDRGDNTGALLWTPGLAQTGTFAVTFHAARGGAADSSATVIEVTGETSLWMESAAGDPVGQGQTYYYTPATGTFSASTYSYDSTVTARYSTPSFGAWSLAFKAPAGARLVPGVYAGALSGYEVADASRPSLQVAPDGRSCQNYTGSFTVKRVTYGDANQVRSLWVIFEQHCGATEPALRGELRINADVGVAVSSPPGPVVVQGFPLRFEVVGTTLDSGLVTLVAEGLPPGATFTDRGQGRGEFAWTPAGGQRGTHVVRFIGTAAGGARDTATSLVRVEGATSLTVDSESGDPVGGGQDTFVGRGSALFVAAANAASGVSLRTVPEGYSAGPRWYLDFQAPFNARLAPGTYSGALRYPATDSRRPGLNVARDYSSGGCSTLDGDFTVREVTYGEGSRIESFWATFDERCASSTGGLHGEIRLNADVPLMVIAPGRIDADRGTLVSFDVRAWSSAGYTPALALGAHPDGATLVDHGDATATFTWTPSAQQTGAHTVAFVADDGHGGRDSALTTVQVNYVNHAPVAHAGGPYRGVVGQPLSFDASASSDPDGDALSVTWDFGDGYYASGTQVAHAYSAAGVYPVRLYVNDGNAYAYDSTHATVDAPLPAKVFEPGGNDVIHLGTGQAQECLQIEPLGGAFAIADVDLGSIRIVYPRADRVLTLAPVPDGVTLDRDRDHDGVREIAACFLKADLEQLVQPVSVLRPSVNVLVQGRLLDGRGFAATVQLVFGVQRKALSVQAVRDPDGVVRRLAFETSVAGPARARLYDVSGRHVRDLLDEPALAPGAHELAIDGEGRRLASGVYFYRVETADGAVSGRLAVVR